MHAYERILQKLSIGNVKTEIAARGSTQSERQIQVPKGLDCILIVGRIKLNRL